MKIEYSNVTDDGNQRAKNVSPEIYTSNISIVFRVCEGLVIFKMYEYQIREKVMLFCMELE